MSKGAEATLLAHADLPVREALAQALWEERAARDVRSRHLRWEDVGKVARRRWAGRATRILRCLERITEREHDAREAA